MQEFVWAFGADAEAEMERQIIRQIEHLKETKDVEELLHGSWSHMDEWDMDEWLEHLEEHLKEIVNIPEKTSRRWHCALSSTVRKSMNGSQKNIRNWQSASGSGDMCWMNI